MQSSNVDSEAETPTLFDIRKAVESDHPMFFNSSLKSFRDSPTVRGIPNTLYFKSQHDVIENILNAPGFIGLVACNPDDSDQIYGYLLAQSLSEDLVFHWIYVKQPFRNYGIARALAAKFLEQPRTSDTQIYYTHRVKSSDRLLKSYPQLVYNPYLLKVS